MLHPTDRLYPGQDTATSGPWTLSRDGKAILTGTERECWTWIRSHTAYSVAHAIQHEGYRIGAAQ